MSITLKWVYPGFFIGSLLLMGLLLLRSDSPSPAIVLFPVVALADIMNISSESMMVPRTLTVLTRKPGPLGTSLSFGTSEVFPFIESALLSELVRRVDQARLAKSTD